MKTSQKVKLTERFVSTLAAPKEGKRLFLDTERRGFGLSVSAGGTKSYMCIRRVPGHGQVRYKFGNVGEMTVAEARRHAEGILARMGMGENPVAQRKAERTEERRKAIKGITLREAVALTVNSLRAKRRSSRTIEAFGRPLELYLSDWLDRPLAELTRTEVRQRHQQVAAGIARGKYLGTGNRANGRKRGPEWGRHTANAVFRTVRSAYNRALREHPELPANPCINVDWYVVNTQRSAIPMEALATWYQGVMKIENPIRRDWLLFVLFSGLRRESASTMRWEDVNFARRVLRVPRPKGGEARAFDLPLSDFLIEILERRKAEHAALCAENERMRPWVWPAESESGHISEPRAEFDGLHWTPHDLRRTFITAAMHWCKLHPYDVKLLVNHALPRQDVTGGYVSPSAEQLRVPMQSVTDKLRALCAPERRRSGKVVRLRARRD